MTIAQFAELFTIAGVVVTMLISVMTGAYVAGQHSNRITNLEERQVEVERKAELARAEAADAAALMAAHGATLKALARTVDTGFGEIKAALRDLTPARARRGAGG